MRERRRGTTWDGGIFGLRRRGPARGGTTFLGVGQRKENRCMPLLCSFPAAQLRRREVVMALHSAPGASCLIFGTYSCYPLSAAHGPVEGPPELPPRRSRPLIRNNHGRPGPALDWSVSQTSSLLLPCEKKFVMSRTCSASKKIPEYSPAATSAGRTQLTSMSTEHPMVLPSSG